LREWYESVLGQTDHDFQLWIGVDGLDICQVEKVMGCSPQVNWIQGEAGDSPAQVRQRALAHIVGICNEVVLVDSDDLLHPSRVAAARGDLRTADVTGCALRLVDVRGRSLGLVMNLPCGISPDGLLPRHNVYGLSNSAFRSDTLRRCLQIPAEVTLVDWFLATRAWSFGAQLTFDSKVRMDYRQYGANTARTLLPFTVEQVRSDTGLVRRHFALLRSHPADGARPDRLAMLDRVAADVEDFHTRVALDPERLARYVVELNAAAPAPLWWADVAYPGLQYLWTTRKEPA
jgi:hypothetical protein